MDATARTELEVLLEQLEELLGGPVLDVEDALEIATVAGSAARLGADPAALSDAEAWRKGDGSPLIVELWEQVDGEPLIEALDAASEGGMTDEEVEEALYDLDDLVVAAIWCKQQAAVRPVAIAAEKVIRGLPDVFVEFADVARGLMRRREVAEELDVYGYWLAVVEAADNS